MFNTMSVGIERFVIYTIMAPQGAFLIPSFFESLYLFISSILTVTKEILELKRIGVGSNGLRCLLQVGSC